MTEHKKILELGLDEVASKESQKRIFFILKLIIFLAVVFILVQYPHYKKVYGLSFRIAESFVFFIFANLIISFSRLTLVFFYLKKKKRENDFVDNFVLGINNIASLLSVIAFILSVFYFFKVDIRQLFTSLSIVAAALALLFKDYISNMINGMILMFSNEISLNDYVKIGEHKGKIMDITLFNVHINNDDDDLVFIPNNSILNSTVLNYTKGNVEKITVEFDLDLQHSWDLNDLEKFIISQFTDYGDHIYKDSLQLKVLKIHKDHITLKFQLIMVNKNTSLEKILRKIINEAILDYISTRGK
ncbi:MAG TPA: mechanosensitive ion channel domain-containing protein [Cytophagaceae bacterium]